MKDYFEDDPQAKRKVLEMLTVANEYCLFLEKAEEYSLEVLLDFLHRVLPLLYLKGSLLPVIESENEGKEERFVVEQQWEDLFNTLKNKFNEKDSFVKSLPADFIAEDITKGSCAENLADLYQDMKDFVMLFMKNTFTAKEAAAVQCHQLFRTHWGPIIAELMPQLHRLIYETESELS
jgi:hydroxymethylpyrimidine pyrophosphatase-like HAD family hydrolase